MRKQPRCGRTAVTSSGFTELKHVTHMLGTVRGSLSTPNVEPRKGCGCIKSTLQADMFVLVTEADLQTFFSGCHDLGVILDGVWIGDWLY
jgi:hypothetical protein